eukprot:scaffold1237_cov243-Pinguiococcus_pyrenoidosus.AAC.4
MLSQKIHVGEGVRRGRKECSSKMHQSSPMLSGSSCNGRTFVSTLTVLEERADALGTHLPSAAFPLLSIIVHSLGSGAGDPRFASRRLGRLVAFLRLHRWCFPLGFMLGAERRPFQPSMSGQGRSPLFVS